MKDKQSIIKTQLSKRVLVLDGAMGTMIQRHKLQEKDFRAEQFTNHKVPLKGNYDILSITQPQIIQDVHIAYLEAGADIVETNTFSANRISQADYCLEEWVYELNLQSARLARTAANMFSSPDRPRFVAGSMGPTNRTASLSPDVNDPAFRAVTFDMLVGAYTEQIRGLLDGGVDLLLIETAFDTLNVKAALYAISQEEKKRKIQMPVMVSATITDNSGRTLSGQTIEAFLTSVSHFPLLSVGINCALGAEQMRPYLERLAQAAPYYISVHPNAGLPNQFGQYDESAEHMASIIKGFLKSGLLNIVGGCCGTTPDHIRKIASLVPEFTPRTPVKPSTLMQLSGLEQLLIRPGMNFVNIGERTNVAGSLKFARLIREGKYDEAVEIAREQVEGGAQVIDVNMDDAMLDAKECMVHFLNRLAAEPDVARLPLMVDSSKADVIEAGLKCVQGKSIVNSISLKEGEEAFKQLARKILEYGAAVVVMAFDEKGQADSLERRIEICSRSYKILTEELAFPPQDIIFDPNILSIATGIEEHNNYAVDFIKTIEWIKANLPHAKVSGGVSNLSFSFRGNNIVREAMHSAFLYHAIKAGMDMGIVNPGMLQVYDEIPADLLERVEDVILNRRADATERLIEFAAEYKGKSEKHEKIVDEWRKGNLEQRISDALVKGIDTYVVADMDEALQKYPKALEIIEGPLMAGMSRVGDLFGAGKMFLPQVVKSARVMKHAVAHLQPVIESQKNESEGVREKILLATVKGDVHDIGKNIVGVVLACNNYEIIDLGVMVPCEKIIEAAIQYKVSIVGLSGLITPSLEEMIHVASEMERAGLKMPLLIGGATTSKLHTAIKLIPAYSGPIVHVKDASKSVPVVGALLSNAKDAFVEQLYEEYRTLADTYNSQKKTVKYLSLREAQANAFKIDWQKETPRIPVFTGRKTFIQYPISELRKYINWDFFFMLWQVKGRYPSIFENETYGEEAKKLYRDANTMLDKMEKENTIEANAVMGIFPAAAVGDDIELYTKEDRKEILTTFYNLRSQTERSGIPNPSLSDFIAPKELKVRDYIGAFVVSAGKGVEEKSEAYKKAGDDYSAILIKALADRLAEAFAELIHLKIRKEYWGYASEENLSIPELFSEKYSGIRPAHGYPACPDHSEKIQLFNLLNAKDIGVSLTDSYMINPPASVCALVFAHPKSFYFRIDKISEEQVEVYAKKKGISKQQVEGLIPINLNYK